MQRPAVIRSVRPFVSSVAAASYPAVPFELMSYARVAGTISETGCWLLVTGYWLSAVCRVWRVMA